MRIIFNYYHYHRYIIITLKTIIIVAFFIFNSHLLLLSLHYLTLNFRAGTDVAQNCL